MPAAPTGPTGTVYDELARAAQESGVPIEVALAAAYHESGFDPQAEGDRGYFSGGRFIPSPSGQPTSFGEYQLHEGGELGDLSPSAAENAYTNAKVALPHFATVRRQHPGMTWGQVVARAQGPANPGAYAQTIDSLLAGYHASSVDPRTYFSRISGGTRSKLVTPTGDLYSGPSTAGASGGAGVPAFSDPGGNVGQVNAPEAPKADDWIAQLDKVLNPSLDGGVLSFVTDTPKAIQLVAVRGAIAVVGVVLLGTGVLLMFGREIFGGALLAIPGVGEAAGAMSEAGAATTNARNAAVARRTQRGADAVNRATGKA